MDDRITELESKLAFTERLVDELNDVVTAQQVRMDQLQSAFTKMEEQIALHGGVSEGEHKKPPHY
jgi:SlyX protein